MLLGSLHRSRISLFYTNLSFLDVICPWNYLLQRHNRREWCLTMHHSVKFWYSPCSLRPFFRRTSAACEPNRDLFGHTLPFTPGFLFSAPIKYPLMHLDKHDPAVAFVLVWCRLPGYFWITDGLFPNTGTVKLWFYSSLRSVLCMH